MIRLYGVIPTVEENFPFLKINGTQLIELGAINLDFDNPLTIFTPDNQNIKIVLANFNFYYIGCFMALIQVTINNSISKEFFVDSEKLFETNSITLNPIITDNPWQWYFDQLNKKIK